MILLRYWNTAGDVEIFFAVLRRVGVPMLFELATAVLLLVSAPDSFPRWAAIVGLVLIALIWLSTVLLQIPCHNQLLNGFDESTYRRLVSSNWIG